MDTPEDTLAQAPGEREARPHAVLDEHSRLAKARKIVALVSAERALSGLRVLEVGCGSGYISRVLAEEVGPHGRLTALDVVDVRKAGGFEFAVYDGERLPFESGAFDVVISNHTLEHVGDLGRQAVHASEIARVLAPGGLAYLAAPNRLFPWEAHYRLPFLGWLPRPIANAYVRVARRGEWFDVYPRSRRGARRLLEAADLTVVDRTPEALLQTIDIEKPSRGLGWLRRVPRRMLVWGGAIMPTYVFIATKAHHAGK